jgi:hypothetical protein
LRIVDVACIGILPAATDATALTEHEANHGA